MDDGSSGGCDKSIIEACKKNQDSLLTKECIGKFLH